MDKKQFISIFGEIAKKHKLESAYGAYFKIFDEIIVVLELQKSNFGNYYYLNIKFFVQGAWGNSFFKSKALAKREMAQVFVRPSEEQLKLFDLDNEIEDELRKEEIEKLFTEFINPIINSAENRKGILKLYDEKKLDLHPPVLDEIRRLEA